MKLHACYEMCRSKRSTVVSDALNHSWGLWHYLTTTLHSTCCSSIREHAEQLEGHSAAHVRTPPALLAPLPGAGVLPSVAASVRLLRRLRRSSGNHKPSLPPLVELATHISDATPVDTIVSCSCNTQLPEYTLHLPPQAKTEAQYTPLGSQLTSWANLHRSFRSRWSV